MSSDQETQDRKETDEATESRSDEETQDTGSDSGSGEEEEELSASEKAKRETEEREEAEKEVQALEEDPPTDLSEWPTGKAQYLTFGGPEGDQGYEEGVTSKLGPSEVRHHEDGSVTVGGEEVDNPEDYKGEPIPGGPTDPNSADIAGEGDNDKDDDDEDDGAPSSERPGPGSQNGQKAADDDSEDDEDE